MRNNSLFWKLTLLLLLACTCLGSAFGNEFVGSGRCASCHQQAYADWKHSDHNKAMAVASTESVLGDFSDRRVSFHNIESRFFERNGRFYVETIGADKKQSEFLISFTFGHYPLQQYLVETDNGHLQALNLAWDARAEEAGGQRWMHLHAGEDLTPDSPFFWTRHLQNWNSRCAQCHSTNVQKNYDAENGSFDTTWSEINVACEACHGPGSRHIARAQSATLNLGSALVNAPVTLQWRFHEDESIAQPVGIKSVDYIDMCGGCHSRRAVIGNIDVHGNYHDQYQLTLLRENLYYPDGQIQDEVYVLGSYMQSKMHAKGVTCMNCHQPHSGKLVLQGNSLCAQCHLPEKFDTAQHHFHLQGSSGARCVECHMPSTRYMLVDDRRDHRFGIPDPRLSLELGTPNACNRCHEGSTATWANDVLAGWLDETPADDPHSRVNASARLGDPMTTLPVLALLANQSTANILKATLLQQLSAIPSRVATEAMAGYLLHPDPLVRVGAVKSLDSAPLQVRWQLLAPLITDPSKSVRMAVAVALSTMASAVPPGKKGLFTSLINEYRKSLAASIDMPSTQAALGDLEVNLGNLTLAEEAFKNALAIEPDFVPALLNLADLYRATKNEDTAAQFLQRALNFAPDSGAVNFSYGLSLIRQQKYKDALPYLKAATEQEDSVPRYAYVYAVALDSNSQTAKALTYLKQATNQWPNQYDLLMTQVMYMEKQHETDDILLPLSTLSKIAPNAPEVRSRLELYIQQ